MEGWTQEDRAERRENPYDHPEDYLDVVERAVQAIRDRQQDNYDNPQWETVIGVLRDAQAEMAGGHRDMKSKRHIENASTTLTQVRGHYDPYGNEVHEEGSLSNTLSSASRALDEIRESWYGDDKKGEQ